MPERSTLCMDSKDHAGGVDDPYWRSEEFIQERMDFIDENFPLPYRRYDGDVGDDYWVRIISAGVEAVRDLRHADTRAIGPLLGIMERASECQMITLEGYVGPRNDPDLDLEWQVMSHNWQFFEAALSSLGSIGDDRAVEPIHDTILRLEYEINRVDAAYRALAEIGSERAVKYLFESIEVYVEMGAEYELRGGPISALEMYPLAAGSVNRVISFLEDSGHRRTRECAAQVLGSSGDPRSIPALVDAIARESEREVRHSAINALERAHRNVGYDAPVFGLDELIDALDDPEIYVCIEAADSLGYYWDEKAVEPLINLYRSRYQWGTQTGNSCLRSLGKIGGEVATTFLIELLKEPDEEVRRAAAGALSSAKHGDKAVDALVESISGKTHYFRTRRMVKAVTDSLMQMAWCFEVDENYEVGGKAENALIALLEDEDTTVRYYALNALAENVTEKLCQEEEACIAALTKAVEDPNDDIREIAEWHCSNLDP